GHTLEEAFPLSSPCRASKDSVSEGLLLLSTPWTELGWSEAVRPRGMGDKVAFLCPHLVDAAGHKLPKAHEGVGGQPKKGTNNNVGVGRAISSPRGAGGGSVLANLGRQRSSHRLGVGPTPCGGGRPGEGGRRTGLLRGGG